MEKSKDKGQRILKSSRNGTDSNKNHETERKKCKDQGQRIPKSNRNGTDSNKDQKMEQKKEWDRKYPGNEKKMLEICLKRKKQR